jgi:hypothetical protein
MLSWLARKQSFQFALPPIKQPQGFIATADFVRTIISPATVGIDVHEVLAQMPRKKPAGDLEIFIMVASHAAAVGFGLGL